MFTETAYSWLENHGKLNIALSVKKSFKESENVKETSKFIQRLNEKRNTIKRGDTGRAEGPGDIPADNRAGDPNTDNIKWDANKKRGTYIFRTYAEEVKVQVYPEPKESNFSKDKDKIKKKRYSEDRKSVV